MCRQLQCLPWTATSASTTMEGFRRISILLLVGSLTSIACTSQQETREMKVLHIPEKIIGGVIDIVQNHKNKPTQSTTTVQSQTQTQTQQQGYQGYPQQYAPWNTGYQQTQGQAQYQGQYGNYGYPQLGNTYPQGGYVNTQGYYGGSQSQAQGQYQNYPQSGNQFQVQNQQTTGSFEGQQAGQFQSQVQTGVHGQGQNGQVQVQNQFQNQQSGQYVNQNQFTNVNIQGSQQVNQPSGSFVQPQPTGSYGGSQQSSNFVGSQQSGSFVGQTQPSHNYVGQTQPQGQVTRPSYVGQNHQSSQFQEQTGNGSNSGFQITTGHHSGAPGPSCVCQAWTKPQRGVLNDSGSQRSEEKVEKTEAQ
ncbi:hypothetical protein PYW08_001325 [Mythimna loreyi]|uniref:Uncharacterized protein n=1 Tax=Mythimna loreyi TaxID=667449 RepID=A0ACC2R2F7_9NEOP|nr:hypothetical protein PYW08_001325 [Mythimna loreyi]